MFDGHCESKGVCGWSISEMNSGAMLALQLFYYFLLVSFFSPSFHGMIVYKELTIRLKRIMKMKR